MQLIMLFCVLFAVGCLTFGGGYAVVGVLQSYFVDRLHWLTLSEFTTGFVIGQITPGPLSTMVAYLGYKLHGLPGATVATMGLLLPSFLISTGLSRAYQRFEKVAWVKAVVQGVRLAVVALLIGALATLARQAMGDTWAIPMALASFLITGPGKKDPVWPFLGAAIAGALLYA